MSLFCVKKFLLGSKLHHLRPMILVQSTSCLRTNLNSYLSGPSKSLESWKLSVNQTHFLSLHFFKVELFCSLITFFFTDWPVLSAIGYRVQIKRSAGTVLKKKYNQVGHQQIIKCVCCFEMFRHFWLDKNHHDKNTILVWCTPTTPGKSFWPTGTSNDNAPT